MFSGLNRHDAYHAAWRVLTAYLCEETVRAPLSMTAMRYCALNPALMASSSEVLTALLAC